MNQANPPCKYGVTFNPQLSKPVIAEIDCFVYDLYWLTEEEIRIVEGAN